MCLLNSKKVISLSITYFILMCFSKNAQGNDATLSFSGYSGLLNTPNAFTTGHGVFSTAFSNKIEVNNKSIENKNLTTTIGILPFAEIGGRIAWFDTQSNCHISNCQLRDLSANIKIQIPFIPSDLFVLAVGQQDIGGQSDNLSTRYVVASKSFNKFDVSVGFGKSLNNNNSLIDGLFSGFEYKPTPWLHFITEDDTRRINAGLRVITPKNSLPWSTRLHADMMIYQSGKEEEGEEKSTFFSLGIKIPLMHERTSKADKMTRTHLQEEGFSQNTTKLILKKNNAKSTISSQNDHTTLERIFFALQEEDFDRVNVGYSKNDTVVISLENTTYSRNDLDAINKIKAILYKHISNRYKYVKLIIKKEGLSVYQINFALEHFYDDRGWSRVGITSESSQFYLHDPTTTWLHKDTDLSYLRPRITLSPALSSTVATEYGVWDYSFGLNTSTTLSLWPGGLFTLKYIKEIDQSEDFDTNGIFYKHRLRSGLNNYGMQQTLKIFPSMYTTLFLGVSDHSYKSLIHETSLFDESGQHKISFLTGSYDDLYQSNISFNSHVVQYRYNLPFYNISSTLTSGKFFEQDSGYRLDFKFWFDNNAITLFYKNTDSTFAGVALSIPLTPARSFNTPAFRLEGENHWTYHLQTQTGKSRNTISFGNARIPSLPIPNDHLLFNEDRLF